MVRGYTAGRSRSCTTHPRTSTVTKGLKGLAACRSRWHTDPHPDAQGRAGAEPSRRRFRVVCRAPPYWESAVVISRLPIPSGCPSPTSPAAHGRARDRAGVGCRLPWVGFRTTSRSSKGPTTTRYGDPLLVGAFVIGRRWGMGWPDVLNGVPRRPSCGANVVTWSLSRSCGLL